MDIYVFYCHRYYTSISAAKVRPQLHQISSLHKSDLFHFRGRIVARNTHNLQLCIFVFLVLLVVVKPNRSFVSVSLSSK